MTIKNGMTIFLETKREFFNNTFSQLTNCTLLIWLISFTVLSAFLIVSLAQQRNYLPLFLARLGRRAYIKVGANSTVANARLLAGDRGFSLLTRFPLGHYKNISRTRIFMSTTEQEKRGEKKPHLNLWVIVMQIHFVSSLYSRARKENWWNRHRRRNIFYGV